MSHAKHHKHKSAVVASHIPGRIRFKLHSHNRDKQTMEEIRHNLEAQEGINDVRLNPACGSMTVRYDHDRHSMSGILGLLEDMDVVIDSIGHLPNTDESEYAAHDGEVPEFMAAVNDLNRRIHVATGLPVDLKLVLPLGFVGAGIWSISKKGLMIESVPGLLFLWLAFDMFIKLHSVHPDKPENL
ncbi:MAG: HMA2 domain-containing protein [Methylobacter sp.]